MINTELSLGLGGFSWSVTGSSVLVGFSVLSGVSSGPEPLSAILLSVLSSIGGGCTSGGGAGAGPGCGSLLYIGGSIP